MPTPLFDSGDVIGFLLQKAYLLMRVWTLYCIWQESVSKIELFYRF